MLTRIFSQKYKLLVLSVILLLGTIIYSNTFYSSFYLDDISSIKNNPFIRNIFNPEAIWSFWPARFITYLSVALNYHLSQLNVFSYHLFNLAVHLTSGIMVCWFVLLSFSTPVMQGQKITQHAKLIALFVSLVFIAHPLQTQGVTYIIQRATSLATLFYLTALTLYVKSRILQQLGESLQARKFYCLSLAVAVMAMFTKETTITLPLMVLLYEICFLKTKKKLDWEYLLPFLATLLIIPLTMFLTKSVDFVGMKMPLDDSPNISSWQYLLTQFRVLVTYLRLLLIPINQNLDYYYPITKNLFNLSTLVSFIFLVSILAIAIKIFSKYRLISFGIFWFFLTLLPESSFIPIIDVIFEHRLYLPIVGFSFFIVSLIYYLFEHKPLKTMVTVLLIIISCYAILTYRRNLIWKDEFALWNDVVHKSSKKARPYNNRGIAYKHRGSMQQAISDYSRAIEINPRFTEAYNNRGYAYYQQGNFTQAIVDFNKAIDINPNFTEAYNNRGNVYYQQGNFIQAISEYNKAIAINPNYAEAYNNRGNLYYTIKEYGKAWVDVRKVERLGYTVNLEFLNALKRALGRDK